MWYQILRSIINTQCRQIVSLYIWTRLPFGCRIMKGYSVSRIKINEARWLFSSRLWPSKPSIIFRGSWGSIENWHEPKAKPPSGNLACPNLTLCSMRNSSDSVFSLDTNHFFLDGTKRRCTFIRISVHIGQSRAILRSQSNRRRRRSCSFVHQVWRHIFVKLSDSMLKMFVKCNDIRLILRFGIGRFTTEEEVDYTAERCILEVNRCRSIYKTRENINSNIGGC